jgi:hypothetical protein
MKSFCIVVTALLASFHVQAESPVLAELPAAIASQTSSKPLRGALPLQNRTVLGLTIGKHSLADVRKRLGAATIVKSEAIDSRPNTVCFVSSTDDTAILFEAGPLGGFETLTAVTVAPRSAYAPRLSNCVTSARVSRISTSVGSLRVGSSIRKVAASLGVTAETGTEGLVEFPFERTTTRKVNGSTEPAEVDTTSGIVARIANDQVVWFSIYYIQSM